MKSYFILLLLSGLSPLVFAKDEQSAQMSNPQAVKPKNSEIASRQGRQPVCVFHAVCVCIQSTVRAAVRVHALVKPIKTPPDVLPENLHSGSCFAAHQ